MNNKDEKLMYEIIFYIMIISKEQGHYLKANTCNYITVYNHKNTQKIKMRKKKEKQLV